VTGVIVPVKVPDLAKVSWVTKSVVSVGFNAKLGSIPSTSNSSTPHSKIEYNIGIERRVEHKLGAIPEIYAVRFRIADVW
jgi:hypothetical protein